MQPVYLLADMKPQWGHITKEALGVLGARDLRTHGTHYSPVSLPFPRPLLGA